MKQYIAIFSHYTQIKAFAEMAQKLKEQYNLPATLWVLGEGDFKYAKQFKAFDNVVDLQPTKQQLLDGIANCTNHLNHLKKVEAEVGYQFINEEIVKDRYFRAQPTIELYPGDVKESWTPENINTYVSVLIQNLQFQFSNNPPVLTYHETNSLPYRICWHIAQKYNIKAGIVLDAKMWPNRVYFEDGLGLSFNYCLTVYNSLLQNGVDEETKNICKRKLKDFVEKMEQPSFFTEYKHDSFSIKNRLSLKRWLYNKRVYKLANSESFLQNPRRLPEYVNSLTNKIKRTIRHKKNKQAFELISKKITEYYNFSFGLYFLHHQPELTIEETALYYMDQVSTVRNIASCLPAGFVLLVKEHKTMPGVRAKSFYEEIKHIPNVVLVHDSVHAHELVKNCSYIFTLTGTIALEGIMYNKPVYIFGDIFYNKFKGVRYVTSFFQLKELLQENKFEFATEEEKICMLASIYIASTPGNSIGTEGINVSKELYNSTLGLIKKQTVV